jgi:hypothetical protein
MSPQDRTGTTIYSFRIARTAVEPLVTKLEKAGYRVVQALE